MTSHLHSFVASDVKQRCRVDCLGRVCYSFRLGIPTNYLFLFVSQYREMDRGRKFGSVILNGPLYRPNSYKKVRRFEKEKKIHEEEFHTLFFFFFFFFFFAPARIQGTFGAIQ